MRCWTNSARAHRHQVLPLLTRQLLVGKRRTQASLDEEYVRNVLLKWRRSTPLMIRLGFLWLATDASTKLSEFYCRICRKDVSVLTYGSSEVLRHFQGIWHFATDQRLRLETPGWRVLGFDGKPLTEDELKRQRDKNLRAPLVVREREYPFREDLIPDASGTLIRNFLC